MVLLFWHQVRFVGNLGQTRPSIARYVVRPSDLGLCIGSCGCVPECIWCVWVAVDDMHAVLIWCNVGSCRRVSGVMGVAMVVFLCAEGI